LQDPAFVSAPRLTCAKLYAEDVQGACSYRMEMVVEREDENSGKIVYVRSIEHDFHVDGTREDPGCSDYIQCLAGIRLGKTIAMPQAEDRAAVAQELFSPWVDKRLYNPQFARELAADYRRQVIGLGENPHFKTPSDKAKYLLAVDLAQYLQGFADRLETDQVQ
jgi:hypothetical protein